MKPGDKVRMLRGKEEGFITKIINEKLVEIEIEDGFRIPAMRNELVVVASEEGNYFEREENVPETSRPKPLVKKEDAGFFLAFHPLNDKDLSMFLINDSANTIPFSIYYQRETVITGKHAGVLQPFSFFKVEELQRKDFEQWPEFILQFLNFSVDSLKSPAERKFKFKASTFFKQEKLAPLIEKKAFIFNIDSPLTDSDREKLHKRFSEGDYNVSPPDTTSKVLYVKPEEIIDLHIDRIVTNYKQIPAQQILEIQLQAFEKALDSAIAAGLNEITFVHGVGNGVLRNAIHKILSKHPAIRYFKDAMKEKFGYGATVVQLN